MQQRYIGSFVLFSFHANAGLALPPSPPPPPSTQRMRTGGGEGGRENFVMKCSMKWKSKKFVTFLTSISLAQPFGQNGAPQFRTCHLGQNFPYTNFELPVGKLCPLLSIGSDRHVLLRWRRGIFATTAATATTDRHNFLPHHFTVQASTDNLPTVSCSYYNVNTYIYIACCPPLSQRPPRPPPSSARPAPPPSLTSRS